jgi:hypothetical protein
LFGEWSSEPMHYRVMTTAVWALYLSAAVAGCSPSERAAPEPPSREQPATLTAQRARQAVLELIRARPDAFIGCPDPDELAELPLEERGEGEYAFGAFVVNLPNRWYAADIGHDAPELYHYRGSFERRNGEWIASEPEVSRFHQPLE